MSMLFPFCKACDQKAEHSTSENQHTYSCAACGATDTKESVEKANMHLLTGGDPDPSAESPFVLKEM